MCRRDACTTMNPAAFVGQPSRLPGGWMEYGISQQMRMTVPARLVLTLAALLLAGCASIHRNPVPIADMDRAVVGGMPGIRDWGDEPSDRFEEDLFQSVRDSREADPDAPLQVAALLLSGGGANGAFGAGFLNGWTQSGNRPTFKIVTGISTGALLAPFAFLGSQWDAELERLYTTTKAREIFRIRNPLTILKKDSLTRTDPLARILEELIDACAARRDCGGAPQGATAVRGDHQPRRAAAGGVEHGYDRR